MTTAAQPLATPLVAATTRGVSAGAALNGSARFWWATMLVGQWAFVVYLVGFYGISTFTGNFELWSQNRMLPRGYVAGDMVGNLVFASHALLAIIIAFGGTLQLVPQIRNRFSTFHRWNGRLFLSTAIVTSMAGLYLTWFRKSEVAIGGYANTLDAVLIVAFGVMAWRAARQARAGAGGSSNHRRWALRAFIVTNAVWFQRVGFMAWIIVNQGPVAMKTFFSFWSFLSYLLPLALLELYLRTKESGTRREKLAMAGTLAVLTLLMAAGTIGFAMGFMFPLLGKV